MNSAIHGFLLCLMGVHHSRVPLHVQVNWTFQGKLLCLTGVFIAALPLLPGVDPVIRGSAPVPHGCWCFKRLSLLALQLRYPTPSMTRHSF